jgi:predicted RNase H-like HicB family nuclease
VFSWGETEEEAIKNAREAKEGILEYMDEHGIPYFLPSEPKEGEILI